MEYVITFIVVLVSIIIIWKSFEYEWIWKGLFAIAIFITFILLFSFVHMMIWGG
jgi:hypothetical protein